MARSTIKDVAREAGVSVGSVSRVLNGLPVSPRLRQKVEEARSLLQYEPNSLARSMRTNSTGAVGFFVPDVANPLYGAIINSLDRRLNARGLMLLLASGRGRMARDVVAEFRRRQVDGLIFVPDSEDDADLMHDLERFSAPTVIQSVEFPSRFYGVRVGYRDGTRQAVDYLLDLGHRRIALLTPLPHLWPGRERQAGYREAFRQHDLTVDDDLIRPLAIGRDPLPDLKAVMQGPDRATALILPGSHILALALQQAREHGLSIPHDLSIISIGDNDWVATYAPAITTLRWPVETLVDALVDLLINQMDDRSLRPVQVIVPTELVLRDSCGPVPSTDGRAC
ncbi:LacI family DNA-binding transcriptional regulator [Marinobacter lacisalsi]|uniref:LacI family DNA-binding transcriptional regulator n=1 Tax=Marinobacter lacisalsi TaxID=475979 RepID=A0ABV8QJ51_9GAMM